MSGASCCGQMPAQEVKCGCKLALGKTAEGPQQTLQMVLLPAAAPRYPAYRRCRTRPCWCEFDQCRQTRASDKYPVRIDDLTTCSPPTRTFFLKKMSVVCSQLLS